MPALAIRVALGAILFIPTSIPAVAQPAELLARFDAYPHAQRITFSEREVIDYEVGLGPVEKRRGVWQLKRSERLSGDLASYTWQIVDGYSANEVLAAIESELADSELRFACDGRSCGQGVQWANRVFHERLLYGRDDFQRYRVYAAPEGSGEQYRILLFSASRTADRQYLHAEYLRVAQ